MAAPDPANKAYWLPIPHEYLLAIGAVIAQWAYFEMQFVGLIKVFERNPEAAADAGKMPGSFGDKTRHARRLAKTCFTQAPTLIARINDFTSRAKNAADKRNPIVHGFWFDLSSFDQERGVIIATEADGTGDFYSIKLDQLEALAVKIAALKMECVQLCMSDAAAGFLAVDELFALQQHENNFPPPDPPVPIVRDQNRKGTVQKPEPLRA